MVDQREAEMTKLGALGLTPFVVSAVSLWLSPWLLPQHIALDFHQFALVYGGIIVAYMAGAGAGANLAPSSKPFGNFLYGQIVTIIAFFTILPSGVFIFILDAAWRHLIILTLLVYLLMRDLAAVSANALPRWYGALRVRLTFLAGVSILLIALRLALWGFY